MKALGGAVALLIALAIGGLVVARQMRAASPVPRGSTAAPAGAASGANVAAGARALERQVADDVARALKQGADARAAGAEGAAPADAP